MRWQADRRGTPRRLVPDQSARRLEHAPFLFLASLAMAMFGLLAAACGSSASEGVAQIESTETTTTGSEPPSGTTSADPAAFSACMRSNGAPNFPDPDRDGRIRTPEGFNPESPQSKAAWRACRELAPAEETPSPAQQAEDREQLLVFSTCMRKHGARSSPTQISTRTALGAS